jgi:long-chain acyl-CoA synthetase
MNYPDVSAWESVRRTARLHPKLTAYEYLGFSASFRALEREVCAAAKALSALGVRPGDRVLLALPNLPQTVALFYACTLTGAVAVMAHPLSAPEEMSFMLAKSRAVAAVTLGSLYPRFANAFSLLECVVLTAPADGIPGAAGRAASLALTKKQKRPTGVISWREFLRRGYKSPPSKHAARGEAPAAILFSGGTSGRMKGIILTNGNINATALQTIAAGSNIKPGGRMLAVMPMFHGFGLGVCVHTALCAGVAALLVPRFTVKSYAKLLQKRRANYIAGVPTLFEALLRLPGTEKMDLSCLHGVFSGGDALSPELAKRVNEFLALHGCKTRVREGYGLTECVTASCLTPESGAPDGSIGLPYPDTLYKIVLQGTLDEAAAGQIGEICIHGPTVMHGYDGEPEETAATLRLHPDGLVWLHSGDLGAIDSGGFVYFRGRIKRLIVTSGYNVYPGAVEDVLCLHKFVAQCCVVGVADDYRMQRIKAFIVPAGGAGHRDIIAALEAHCRRHLSPFERPREYAFLDALPRTKLGKVAYTELTDK